MKRDPLLAGSSPIDDGSTGIEAEDLTSGDVIQDPFDPTLLRISTQPFTVDLLLKRIRQGAIDLSPGFQRRAGIWTDAAQSRLIESILIRIPIPAFYMDATEEDRWLVVDGLQRLTALRRFVIAQDLKLRGLEFLTTLHGKTFDDLSPSFQRRIEETQLTLFKIEAGTPANVTFNIFKRINTGGLPLSAQEIRHALYHGKATELLSDLAQSEEFLQATDRGINDKRLAAQECILRFLAFTLTPYTEYKEKDFDGFLNQTMVEMNDMPNRRLKNLGDRFRRAMSIAYRVFGNKAFRKTYSREVEGRPPINKPLFEAWSVNLDRLNEDQATWAVERREALTMRFIKLMNTSAFNDSISLSTGNLKKVQLRFESVETLIREVLS